MTHVCDFPTDVRLLEVGTLSVLLDLHDPDNGFDITDEIVQPDPNQRQARLKSARAHGSYGVGARLDDDGLLVIRVGVFGSTWGQCTTRVLAMLEGLRAADRFYVETALSGVTTRYFCDAPVDVNPEPIEIVDRAANMQRYELRFTVQPRPTVTIGA
jgi:hypothetical protein